MNRREALKKTGLIAGYALSATAIAAVVQACKPESGASGRVTDEWRAEFFDEEQMDLIAELTETILPETVTPGAKSVHVHRYIDDEVEYMFSPQEQYDFVLGLEDVQGRAMAIYGKKFQACDLTQRMELLKILEGEAKVGDWPNKSSGYPFFNEFKSMCFAGYFTSERIGKEVLNYDPVPAQYEGCIEIDDSTLIWSL